MPQVDHRFSTVALHERRNDADDLRAAWRSGQRKPDAVAAIDSLGGTVSLHKSIVLDLAYEEYRIRSEAGEKIDCDRFTNRFSTVSLSLRQRILAHHTRPAVPSRKWPAAGDVISGFELSTELGRGSFGRVFLAKEIQLRGRQVVVKIAEQGIHEAQLLAQVPHSGVVPIYSVGTDAKWGLTTQCMPFISRATLLDVIELIHGNREQPPVRAKQIADAARSLNCTDDEFVALAEPEMATYRGTFADGVSAFGCLAANALEVTHERGIRHSDIKPSNILVDQFGCPVLIDFNLSSEPRSVESSGGTLPYMAPEQLEDFCRQGESRVGVSPAADVFSLGVCLFELLYGKHPYTPIPVNADRNELTQFLIAKQQQGPRSDVDPKSLVDGPLKAIIARCLEIDPGRRPTAAELSATLQKTQSTVNRFKRMVRLHPRMAKATAGLVLGGALTLGVAKYLQPESAERQWELVVAATDSQDYAGAKARLNELLRLEPNNPKYLAARGHVLIHLQEFHQAIRDSEAAYNASPSLRVATQIAWGHANVLNYAAATSWYRKLIDKIPDDAVLRNNYGFVLLRDMQLNRAIEQFSEAIRLNPKVSIAWYNRADAKLQKALNSRTPTPFSALRDLEESGYHGLTGEGAQMRCRISATLAVPDQKVFIDSIMRCISTVPRSRLESDELLTELWNDTTRDWLQGLSEDTVFSRPTRLVPPSP